MKTNNRKAFMKRHKWLQMTARDVEKQAQACNDLAWAAEESYFRRNNCGGSASKAWQRQKRYLAGIGYLTNGKAWKATRATVHGRGL